MGITHLCCQDGASGRFSLQSCFVGPGTSGHIRSTGIDFEDVIGLARH